MNAPSRSDADFAVLPGFLAVLRRELLLAWRTRAEVAQPVIFFIMVASLFPLGIGADPKLLARVGAGVAWVCGVLATLLSLSRIFAQDYADGTLEQMVLSPYPLPSLAAGKLVAHWLTTGLPLSLTAPLIGLQFGMDVPTQGLLVSSLLIGSPILSMIGAIAAALTLGARGQSLLIALLVLPLYVPVIIFGSGAVEAFGASVDFSAYLALLGAGTLTGLVATPFVVAAAIRIALD